MKDDMCNKYIFLYINATIIFTSQGDEAMKSRKNCEKTLAATVMMKKQLS